MKKESVRFTRFFLYHKYINEYYIFQYNKAKEQTTRPLRNIYGSRCKKGLVYEKVFSAQNCSSFGGKLEFTPEKTFQNYGEIFAKLGNEKTTLEEGLLKGCSFRRKNLLLPTKSLVYGKA